MPAIGLRQALSPEKEELVRASFESDLWPALRSMLVKGGGKVLGGKSIAIQDLLFFTYFELIAGVSSNHFVSTHDEVKEYRSAVQQQLSVDEKYFVQPPVPAHHSY